MLIVPCLSGTLIYLFFTIQSKLSLGISADGCTEDLGMLCRN